MAAKRKLTPKSDEARRSLVQQLAAQISWFHNCVLLDRVTELSSFPRKWESRPDSS